VNKIVAWGLNHDGQLGDGTQTKPPGPVLVTGLPEAGRFSSLRLAFRTAWHF
jgi:hypothetical protein